MTVSQLPTIDQMFLRREHQYENMKTLYQVTEISKRDLDENKIWFSVLDAFRNLSCNGHVKHHADPGYIHDLDVYITLQSIKENYPKCCKVAPNDSWALRLYNVLSNGKLMKRIYVHHFMLAVHPLIYGNWVEKNLFAFRLYDGDNDGIISSIDMSDIIKNLLSQCPMDGLKDSNMTRKCTCVLYKEVMKLYKMNLHNDIYVEQKKLKKNITFQTFLQESDIGISCLVIELQ